MFAGLKQMLPVLPVDNPFDVGMRNAKAISNGLQGKSGIRSKLANSDDLCLGYLGASMPIASGSCAMTQFIGFVFQQCRPSKINRAIIAAIAIPVGCLMAFRSFAVERRADNHMDIFSKISTEMHATVATSRGGSQQEPRQKVLPSETIHNPPINRPHAPKAARLIARMVRHWTPLFGFGYRVHSHLASPQRCGQGLATGWRLSSVPHSIARALLPQYGICILAARV